MSFAEGGLGRLSQPPLLPEKAPFPSSVGRRGRDSLHSQIGSTLISGGGEWRGPHLPPSGLCKLLPPVKIETLFQGGGNPSLAWQGVAAWQGPSGVLGLELGEADTSLLALLPQSMATSRVGASGSWRTAGPLSGG